MRSQPRKNEGKALRLWGQRVQDPEAGRSPAGSGIRGEHSAGGAERAGGCGGGEVGPADQARSHPKAGARWSLSDCSVMCSLSSFS